MEMNKLTNSFIKYAITTNNPEIIYWVASNSKNLSKENIDDLVSYIISTKKAEYIYKFAKNVNGLSKENIDSLVKGIIATKNKIYIAKILYDMKDINLINKIFGSFDKYVMFCLFNKINININIDELMYDISKLEFSYVDDNIDKCLEEDKGNVKSLS